jgi:spore maturation protein CgeB
MTPQSKIIFVGALWNGSTALHRMLALRSLAGEVIAVNSDPDPSAIPAASLLHRIQRRLVGPQDLTGANAQILSAAENTAPDILWIDKGLTIAPTTMRAVRERHPRCLMVGYSPDDMTNPGNQSRRFLDGLSEYDVYFTTKSYGVRELTTLGARHVIFIGNAYDSATHRPCTPTMQQRAEFGGVVGFIGQWEAERSSSICALARAGVPVRVWGQDWTKCRCSAKSLRLERRPIWGEHYSLALCSFDINLCFLRKSNRDRQTTRSVEIPACGAFMLAERTEEHLALFEEGKEAEFFAGDTELIEKVRYYIAHPDVRQAIATAGRERCLRSEYSNLARMRQMLSVVDGLRH